MVVCLLWYANYSRFLENLSLKERHHNLELFKGIILKIFVEIRWYSLPEWTFKSYWQVFILFYFVSALIIVFSFMSNYCFIQIKYLRNTSFLTTLIRDFCKMKSDVYNADYVSLRRNFGLGSFFSCDNKNYSIKSRYIKYS